MAKLGHRLFSAIQQQEDTMHFAGMNYLAILVAAAAGFIFSFAWYASLGKQWMAAVGKSEDALKQGGMAGPLVVSVVAQLVIAFMLAGTLGHLGTGQMTIKGGVLTGAMIWFGFVMTTMAVNYAWQWANAMLNVIDGFHWLGVFVLQGLVIGWLGV
ncbi:MAG: hypothetical protein ACI9MJ_002559 [Alphaproteobacteria bacterium]